MTSYINAPCCFNNGQKGMGLLQVFDFDGDLMRRYFITAKVRVLLVATGAARAQAP